MTETEVLDKVLNEPYVFWDSFEGKRIEISEPHFLDRLVWERTDKTINLKQFIKITQKQRAE